MFDYAEAMKKLVADIASRCDVFRHVDMSAVLVGCIKARSSSNMGLYARTVPMRFEDGSHVTTKRGLLYRVPKVIHDGNEILYIVSFCLPRFQDLSFDDKITTIFHELYHISPRFDGDIRRFDGRHFVHGSQKKYDELMKSLADEYLRENPDSELAEFLKLSWEELSWKHEAITWTIYRAPRPQLIRSQTAPATAKKGKKGEP